MNILVIDDDKMMLDLIQLAFKNLDSHVVTAETGKDAIRKFNETGFDVVIADLYLPDIDGNGLAHYIRNTKRRATPIIGISGKPDQFDEHVFDHILPKPFSIKLLINIVTNLSTKKRLAYQNV